MPNITRQICNIQKWAQVNFRKTRKQERQTEWKLMTWLQRTRLHALLSVRQCFRVFSCELSTPQAVCTYMWKSCSPQGKQLAECKAPGTWVLGSVFAIAIGSTRRNERTVWATGNRNRYLDGEIKRAFSVILFPARKCHREHWTLWLSHWTSDLVGISFRSAGKQMRLETENVNVSNARTLITWVLGVLLWKRTL